MGGAGLAAIGPGIDDPHDDAAEEQGNGHGLDAAEILFAPFVQQQSGSRRESEGDEGEGDGVIEPGAVAVFAFGKGAEKLDDARQEEKTKSQDCAQLDDDGVHLPVGVIERNLHQSFRDAQVRR